MANFWCDQVSQLGNIQVSTAASIMMEETPHQVDIAICDPTKENPTHIDVTLEIKAKEVIEKSSEIEIIELGERVRLRLHTHNKRGKKATFSLVKADY